MPRVKVVIYCEAYGAAPFVEWFAKLPGHAQDKAVVRLRRLRDLGHEMRRPEADYLRDGIYELRAAARGVQYRLLYFFHGRTVAVVAHGIVKEQRVPDRDIEIAIGRKLKFEANPRVHTREEF